MKVSVEVKAAFDKLKSQNAALKQQNAALNQQTADLIARVRTLENANAEFAAAADQFTAPARNVQTTQATAKIWKLWILAGGVGFLVGFFLFGHGLNIGNHTETAAGAAIATVGLGAWLFGRFGKFWFHE